ncbi:MAG TPA: MerR family transcriptional regulator [Actinotalea caeni]|uniref:MerR family transcriptional regulator n=1 Tax=Actinotalea caeni TaxID=1348467 RepID=UPI002B4B167F|nr:MerR family transcriptional regulator [Actinotalea caeni]HLV56852.1 MerR family transcriptional regulator [Actinotalea caeni]
MTSEPAEGATGPASGAGAAETGGKYAVTGSDVPFYTIGQVAEVLGVPVAQLRRLDDLEIVQPSRSQGNQRRYTQNEIALLREVIDLTQEGVSLAGARMVIELRRRVEDLEAEVARLRAGG